MLFYIILMIVGSVSSASQEKCEPIPVNGFKSTSLASYLGSSLNPFKYDTKKIGYYVMTSSSKPDFANSNGGQKFDWSECSGKPVLFGCHGWAQSYNTSWQRDLLKTYVEQTGGCAVAVDYSGAANNLNYFYTAFQNTGNIAKAIADYVAENICTGGRNCTKDLQFHSHSWGAHTCGVAGYLLGQRGMKPYRFLASDAAGLYFNTLSDSDVSKHLSPQSATKVIIFKTSGIIGASKPSWAHQFQYIGKYGKNQEQCSSKKLQPVQHEFCDHTTAVFVVKSTINNDFPLIKLNQCSYSQGVLENCTNNQDNLGWRSEGKPGIFMIETLPVCLNVTL